MQYPNTNDAHGIINNQEIEYNEKLKEIKCYFAKESALFDTKIEKLNTELNNEKLISEKLRRTIKQYTTEIETNKENYMDEHKKQNKKFILAKDRADNAEIELTKKIAEVNSLLNTNNDLKRDLEKTNEEITSLKDKLMIFTSSKEKLAKEANSYLIEINDLKKLCKKKQNQIENLQDDLNEKSLQENNFQRDLFQFESMQENMSQLTNDDYNKTIKENKKLSNEILIQKEQIQYLNTQLNESMTKNEKDLEEIEIKYQKLQEDAKELVNQCAMYRNHEFEWKTELEESKKQLKEAHKKYELIQNKKRSYKSKLKEAEEQIKELNKKLATQILSSKQRITNNTSSQVMLFV